MSKAARFIKAARKEVCCSKPQPDKLSYGNNRALNAMRPDPASRLFPLQSIRAFLQLS